MIAFENKPEIGKGIYTLKDVATILHLPYAKVHRWVCTYWDGKLGKEFQLQYSWERDGSRAVSFHTVVELYIMIQLAEKGVKTSDVLKAHQRLSEIYLTPFPFAQKEVLEEINTDGTTIFWKNGENLVSLNGSNQFNLNIIKFFFKKLEFDGEVVSKLWPMGKDHSIVIDPLRKFGHPIIEGKNIYPETIYGHFKAGDPLNYISYIYQITEKEAEDAINYCKQVA
ncbi:hypothetical protein P872_22275 [Rhodonellum psychrophilum GCM71 = DSM 17998]|uniref:DUF433 domain-containing protein n=2 Tax=Rhodonellum TaxID=336827 RepID=U5BRM5_9BACT|nr:MULTISPECIES: DUF433 domain-containing protein [Rhodonellum]ERM80174.1 hypothetical protein P872_22275 [Rhodonellum psychrophilum GCM71 = DSM 17998]SDZ59421.1 Uncharacterized conserved protein, DUF433 family [Rhodonellum ikkaensis]